MALRTFDTHPLDGLGNFQLPLLGDTAEGVAQAAGDGPRADLGLEVVVEVLEHELQACAGLAMGTLRHNSACVFQPFSLIKRRSTGPAAGKGLSCVVISRLPR